jgi:phosphoglycerate dehydrogenase-like enzyme
LERVHGAYEVGVNFEFGEDIVIHFETRAEKPRAFRLTPALIDEAKERSGRKIATSFGESWLDLSVLAEATGLVTAMDLLMDPKFPRFALDRAAPRLKWIHVTGAGVEPLLPLDWLPAHVTLTNNSGVHAAKVRESILMMLLMLQTRIPAMITNQRYRRWRQIFSSGIRGRTALIVGVGDMGGAAAAAARDLQLRVMGARRSGAPHASVDEMYRVSDLDTILPQADFVICSVPLTPETTMLMDRRRIGLMKIGAGFVNIGRAGSVDYDALSDALRGGALSGAIIDVYDEEPLPVDSPLWNVDNLIMTPHVSSDDEDEYVPKTLDLAFENAMRLARGEALLNIVDRRRGY